jgi:hypothetical protein
MLFDWDDVSICIGQSECKLMLGSKLVTSNFKSIDGYLLKLHYHFLFQSTINHIVGMCKYENIAIYHSWVFYKIVPPHENYIHIPWFKHRFSWCVKCLWAWLNHILNHFKYFLVEMIFYFIFLVVKMEACH